MPSAALLALTWDAWISLVLSVGAFVIAFLSAVFAYLAHKRAGRAEERAERAERRDVERFERELTDAEAADRARLLIHPRGSQRSIDNCRFAFRIANHGQATAYDIDVWLVDSNDQDVTLQHPVKFSLEPDTSDDRQGVVVAPDAQPEDLRFALSWSDGGGDHPADITDIHPSN